MPRLPDAAWLERVNPQLADDEAWQKAAQAIDAPLYLKVKDADTHVILAVGSGADAPPLALHEGDTVDQEGAIIVSTGVDTWDRLLRGSTDLMTAFMGRDIKAKASMMTLMRISDPAETLLQRMGAAQREIEGAA